MVEVYGIVFKPHGKMYYFKPNDLDLSLGDYVIVETERGLQFGTVLSNKEKVNPSSFNSELKSIIKKADDSDIEKNQKNIKDASKALIKIRNIVENSGLEMQIIDADFTFDRSQLMIKFLADSRVDFRKLAKELAAIYKTRIELRQVGARDKAKEIGGIGICGRSLCCSKFLDDLESVSINMAKNQNISLNPNKINGACGRLLCCLKYEDEAYKECRKNLPHLGKKVIDENGNGTVASIDILNGKYTVDYGNNVIEYTVGE